MRRMISNFRKEGLRRPFPAPPSFCADPNKGVVFAKRPRMGSDKQEVFE